nr:MULTISPECIES: recombinase family protein [Protofrankia]
MHDGPSVSRHSTDKQTNARQLHALDSLFKSGAPRYEDPATSSRVYAINRSGFRRLLDEAAVGDTIRIADAARLFRSTKDVIQIREVLQRRGMHLRIATGAWSGFDLAADDPQTKLFVTMLAGVLEFQRDMISENTKEGVAAAEAAGKTLGRPAALDEDKAADVVDAYAKGAAVKVLARQ